MATNECSVVNPAVYGPYKQTIFLGCSVLGFTATAGWNGQNSEVTVELAQDTCAPPVDRPKRYWANPNTIFQVAQLWYGADPGFTFPNMGAPVYFRVEDFEYSGLIQGWTVKESPSGSPVYTVKIVDPRPVLDHTQIILDSYEGSINGIYNLLNVYAYLEYTSGGTGNSNTDCADNVVGGIGIGAPAKGFGGAQRTERGIPWDIIKDGIQDLAGSLAGTPDSRFSMGGLFYREGSGKGWGELNFGNSGNVGTAKYIVDISDVPDAYFTEYRIGGPITSLSEIINQVCQDAGCDYYVELLPTGGQLVIKVRTISRRNQPALTGISSFILGKNILYGGEGIVNDSYGRELRSEINTSFVIGAKARQYFEQEASSYMTPFWGYDAEGNLMESKLRSGTANNWQVLLDFRKINLALNNPVSLDITTNSKGSTGFGWVEEIELRLAQGDYDTFKNKILSPIYPDTVLKKYFETTVKLGASRLLELNPADVRAVLNFPPGQESDKKSGDVTGSEARDGQAVYNWLRSYSSTFYGKQFLFQVPHVCKAIDSTSGKEVFSDEPSSEGAWPSLIQGGSLVDNTDLLGITVPSTQADFFRDETGKVQAMVKLTGSNLDTSALDVSDYLVHGNNVWVKATIESEWIQGTPVQGVSDDNVYAALIKIPATIFNKVAALSTKTNVELLEMIPGVPDALKAGAADAPKNTAGLSATTGAAAFEAVMPIAGGIPLKSNTRTYGPWYRTGANPGAVSCEIDEGLAPWEYGGIAFMNKAGQAKVHNAVTSMQYGERGEVTVPGYPRISLGSALSTNPPSFLYDGRQVGTGGHSWPRGGWSYNYISWNNPSESTTGATVSNINVTVGTQGVTTSYTISTFTPVFGRFAKGNAERLKQIGLNKLSGERELRARNALKRLLRASEGRLGQGADHGLAVNAESPKSAAVLFAGKLVEDKKRKVVLAGNQSSFPYYQDYDNTAMMSMDGFFRPVSNYGDADLPKIATNSGSCLLTQTEGPPPPVSGYSGLPILQKYLDFLADPVSNATLLDDTRANSSTEGHDVESVGRESVSWLKANQPDGSRSLLVHVSGSQTYADDYRYMAMRGPMVMQSWGYDLHGKPIPNEVGDATGTFADSYEGLKDTFKQNWLSDAREWPVAPIDLRFDRKRGVWTVPSAFRLYQVKTTADIGPGREGDAEILKYKDDIVDGSGSGISAPTITIENFSDSLIAKDAKTLAYYDTADCKYWAMSAGGINIMGEACTTPFNNLTNSSVPLKTLIISNGLTVTPDVSIPDGYRLYGLSMAGSTCGGGAELPSFIPCTIQFGRSFTIVAGGSAAGDGPLIKGPLLNSSSVPGGVINGVATPPIPGLNGFEFRSLRAGYGLTMTKTSECGAVIQAENIIVGGPPLPPPPDPFPPIPWPGPPGPEDGGGWVEPPVFIDIPGVAEEFPMPGQEWQPEPEFAGLDRPGVPNLDRPGGLFWGNPIGMWGNIPPQVRSPAGRNLTQRIRAPMRQLNFGYGFVVSEYAEGAKPSDINPGGVGGIFTVNSVFTVGNIGPNIHRIGVAEGGESDGTLEGDNPNSTQGKLGPMQAISATTRSTEGLREDVSVILGTAGYAGEVEVMSSVACVDGELKYYQKKLVFSGGLLQSVSEEY